MEGRQEKVAGNPDAVDRFEKARGYLAHWDQTIVEHATEEGVEATLLRRGDRIRVPTWMKEILAWEENEEGVLITIPEVLERRPPTHVIEQRVDVNLGLTAADVELLIALCKKVKFSVEETFELGKYRALVNKLRGFEQLELIDSGEEEVGEEDGEPSS